MKKLMLCVAAVALYAVTLTNPHLSPHERNAALVAAADVVLPPDRRITTWWKRILGPRWPWPH